MTDSGMNEDIQELREEVRNYTPGSSVTCPDRISFPDKMFIGLFGQTGCGKSSLINSLKYAVMGRLSRAKWLQVASQEKAGGHTMYRKSADITKCIFVIDNRGLVDPKIECTIEEIAAQLDGKRGYSEIVEWDGNSADELSDYTGDDGCNGHKISCAVFVFSANHDINMNTSAFMDIVDFLHGHQGRYPIAVITHVDKVEKSEVEKLKTVLKISGVSDVFEVANVTEEKPKLEEVYQLNLLMLLERCMTDADETLIFKHYQKREENRKANIREKRLQEEKQREQERKTEAEAFAKRELQREKEREKERRREAEARAEREKQERERERERRIAAEARADREKQEREREQERKRETEALAKRDKLEKDNFRLEETINRHGKELERLMKEREMEQRKAEEREQRFQAYVQGMARDHREEIRRIMDANKREPRSCLPM
ncbi:uncharacterized protein [Diadema setosum]|uniref:uncharacterized protein n=1 Tax=Diadema setosum TaxID=31175 RepID=UPI003B3B46C0